MDVPVVARTRAELQDALAEGEAESSVVMTMGALHDGHAALIRHARALVGDTGHVIVTIFVNPLQFAEGEDFDRYPRAFENDLNICAAEGVDLVFAPTRAEMYPGGDARVTVDPGPLGRELEGAARPTHFAGVLTVVAKLLNLTVPAYAVFGEKDYQQLTLVRRMADDLEMPYEIVGAPTVREADGLALSSRNRYLSADERAIAAALSEALAKGAEAGHLGREAVLRDAVAVLERHTELLVDYLVLRTPDLASDAASGESRLLVAARIGSTRLLDNIAVDLGRATSG
ncbi:pantoate--beta-alanine ligase [Phytoactinopolyspora endophytica]|uniref:pantoate--beta-alanine ligase n=1 Tax=Phytoactinopolyspora endophytica TaxID=1642495 RepID=UPI00197B4EC6|nr:pantoate--beta-alanine ligase [Phytoactinopolyspora endophytica]